MGKQIGKQDWNKVHKFMKNNLIDNKVKVFQWLVLNNAVYTETNVNCVMLKMRI